MVAQAVGDALAGRRVLVLAATEREATRINWLIRRACGGQTVNLRCISSTAGVPAVRGDRFDDVYTDHLVYDVDNALRGACEIVEWISAASSRAPAGP